MYAVFSFTKRPVSPIVTEGAAAEVGVAKERGDVVSTCRGASPSPPKVAVGKGARCSF